MQENDEILRVDLENFTPVEDLVSYFEDYGFEFPVRAGKLLKVFSCDGLAVLEDRQ